MKPFTFFIQLKLLMLLLLTISAHAQTVYFAAGTPPPGCTNCDGSTALTPRYLNGATDWATYVNPLLCPSSTTSANLTLYFDSGTYENNGHVHLANRTGSVIVTKTPGSSGLPVFKLAANAAPSNGEIAMFRTYPYSWGVYVKFQDVKIDMNWSQQTSYNGTSGYRMWPLRIRSEVAEIIGVKVENFGANGKGDQCNQDAGVEAFGIHVTVPNFETEREFEGRYGFQGRIQSCEVSNFYGPNQGYCTGIMVCTQGSNDSGEEDYWQSEWPPQKTTRSSTALEVSYNYVHHIGAGIGFGCADSQQVIFEHNSVYNALTGFNCDTRSPRMGNEPVADITLRDNVFWVTSGISIGSVHNAVWFKRFTVTSNDFMLDGWAQLPQSQNTTMWVEPYAVRFNGRVGDSTVSYNTVDTLSSLSFSYPPSSYFTYDPLLNCLLFDMYYSNPALTSFTTSKRYWVTRTMGYPNTETLHGAGYGNDIASCTIIGNTPNVGWNVDIAVP